MGDIADGIFDLPLGQRAAAPIGKARALVDRQAHPGFDQIGIADLFRLADRHHRDLRVENRVRGLAGQVDDDFHVLPAGVEDLQHVFILAHQIEQGFQINPRRHRINRGGFFGIGDLHQAQFGPIGVFAHEFGVDRDKFGLGETFAEFGKGFGGVDQRVNFHVIFSHCGRSAALGFEPIVPLHRLTKCKASPVSAPIMARIWYTRFGCPGALAS